MLIEAIKLEIKVSGSNFVEMKDNKMEVVEVSEGWTGVKEIELLCFTIIAKRQDT